MLFSEECATLPAPCTQIWSSDIFYLQFLTADRCTTMMIPCGNYQKADWNYAYSSIWEQQGLWVWTLVTSRKISHIEYRLTSITHNNSFLWNDWGLSMCYYWLNRSSEVGLIWAISNNEIFWWHFQFYQVIFCTKIYIVRQITGVSLKRDFPASGGYTKIVR